MTGSNTSIRTKTRHPADFFTYVAIYVCAILSVALLLGIIVYVFVKGIRSVNWEFLTSVTSVLKGTTGIAGNIVNTLYIIIVTMLIATPIGVGAAVYLNEYAKPGKLVSMIEFATETLAGIPSIIFGLFGMMFFGQTLHLKYSILTGSFTLTLMVLPLITRNTQEALKTVPDSYRSGAIGLGSRKVAYDKGLFYCRQRCRESSPVLFLPSDELSVSQQPCCLRREVRVSSRRALPICLQRRKCRPELLPFSFT